MPKDTGLVQKLSRNLFPLRSSLTRRCANASNSYETLRDCGSLFHSPPKSKYPIKINLHIWNAPSTFHKGKEKTDAKTFTLFFLIGISVRNETQHFHSFIGLRFASPNLQFFTKPSVLTYRVNRRRDESLSLQ